MFFPKNQAIFISIKEILYRLISVAIQKLFTKDSRARQNAVSCLEDIGFVCTTNDDTSSSLCIDGEKKLVLSISDESRLDSDSDHVPDLIDCAPYDPSRQDFYKKPTLNPIGGDEKHTLHGYRLDDYYFSGSNWMLKPGAQPVKKRWWQK